MRNQRTERGPVSFPPPLIYVAGLVTGLFLEAAVRTPDPPRPLRLTLLVLAVLAVVLLDARAVRLFRRNRTAVAPWHPTTRLVTDGPYRISRNPMYLGMAVTYLAVTLAFGLLWGLLLLPVVILVVDRAVIRREEVYLEKNYGDEYRRYKRSVRRWL